MQTPKISIIIPAYNVARTVLKALFTPFLLLFCLSAFHLKADLPDIGTSGLSTLTFEQEKIMGDYYTRLIRADMPMINDPLLDNYINQLGQKLAKNTEARLPFHFYLIRSQTVNAFAYFGGNIVLFSRLILDTDNESELASVMAHEMGHVTQRHLARQIEEQKNSTPATIGGILGGILVGLLNPEGGMAIVTGTLAANAQGQISFSQSNEKEADRIGFQTLVKSGFDPQASPDFLQKLADDSRYSNEKVFAILMTHPNPGSRVADMRNRANQYPAQKITSSIDYFLFKSRITIFTGNERQRALFLESAKKSTFESEKIAYQYALALDEYNQNQFNAAKNRMINLLKSDPDNIWYLDLITDLDLKQHKAQTAIDRLETALKKNPDQRVLQLNLINALIEKKDFQQAVSLLNRYTVYYPDDLNGWNLMIDAQKGLNQRFAMMMAQAQIDALYGAIPRAIEMLKRNINNVQDRMTHAKMDALILDLEAQQKQFKKIMK